MHQWQRHLLIDWSAVPAGLRKNLYLDLSLPLDVSAQESGVFAWLMGSLCHRRVCPCAFELMNQARTNLSLRPVRFLKCYSEGLVMTTPLYCYVHKCTPHSTPNDLLSEELVKYGHSLQPPFLAQIAWTHLGAPAWIPILVLQQARCHASMPLGL